VRGEIHIITGVTAVGKTSYALEYADAHNAEIISCDASLVYRGMDIGTAKPSKQELAQVPHHLIDLLEVREPCDIVTYNQHAQKAVDAINARGKSIVVTGGSGFYLKSFVSPVVDLVVVPKSVRSAVSKLYDESGLAGLLEYLNQISKEGLGQLDCRNPRRVQRALERCIASGKSLPQLHSEFEARPNPYASYDKRLILLARDPDDIRSRVELRAAQMLRQGLIDEVRALMNAGIESNPSAASAIGYRETINYINGHLSADELMPLIIKNTMQLVKKQRTWLRSQIQKPDQIIQLTN
tara:strand:- start:196 stop:1086 length:891 start_codon:yes stop_codon:yes gene_type:complete